MKQVTDQLNEEGAIRAEIEAWAESIRTKNPGNLASHFVSDAVRFYLAPPLEADTPLEKNAEEWFGTFEGPIGYEIRDLKITTSGALACASSFNRIAGKKTSGEASDFWFRETLCLRKIDGRWLIVHSHESVPFLMDGSNKAALDLKP